MKSLLAAAALLGSMTSAAMADPVGGPARTGDAVQARSENLYDIVLYGGETTLIAVSGDGDTDLDLYVYDENGNLIVSDTDALDDCIVAVHPRWTGQFTIRVVNLGRIYNQFVMTAW